MEDDDRSSQRVHAKRAAGNFSTLLQLLGFQGERKEEEGRGGWSCYLVRFGSGKSISR